jgi:predicted DNA-binding transcriptional regulator AlpA
VSEWRVRVEARGPEPLATGEDSIATFLAQLADRGGTVAGGPGLDTYSAQLTVEAPTPGHAVTLCVELIRRAAAVAGLPEWPVVHAQATGADEHNRQLAIPIPSELVGISEIAAILGVSRQRAHALVRRSDFPEPIARLASGSVWTRPSIDLFVESWKRKPGRPSKEEAENLDAGILSQGAFRRDRRVSDAVGPDDAELVMDLIRNASGKRLRFDTIETKLGWERPRLSWVVAELARTFRITYQDGWASLRRCPRCGSDRIRFKEIAVGRRHDPHATIQGPPYCPDCGRDAR